MGSGRLRAIQPKQSFHDANLNDTDDSPTVVTVQFDVSALDGRDNGARTVDATEPVWHAGHQGGKLITELAVHESTRNTRRCDVRCHEDQSRPGLRTVNGRRLARTDAIAGQLFPVSGILMPRLPSIVAARNRAVRHSRGD
jgi:hypothetical protein